MTPKQLSIPTVSAPNASSPSKPTTNGNDKTPLIISASRRTDLPGFYPGECSQLIQNKIRRLRSRFLHSVMFWSKHPAPFLQNHSLRSLVEELENPLLQLTITGLGGTKLESGIPHVKETLALLPNLIALFKDEPQRIRWRFDPILKDYNGIEQFVRIAEKVASLGMTECTVSFPTYFSLKGDLTPQFNAARIPPWQPAGKAEFLHQLVDTATAFGISLFSCAQPDICDQHAAIRPAACIDAARLESLHPRKLPVSLPKDPSQRAHCRCVKSDDVGSYQSHPCGGQCVYCYSKAGGKRLG